MENRIQRLIHLLGNLGIVLGGLSLAAIFVMMLLEVVLRPFRISPVGVDQIVGFLNVAVVFLGMAYSLRTGSFVRVELIYNLLNKKLQHLVQWFIVVASLLFVCVLFYYTLDYVIYSYGNNILSLGMLTFPEFYPRSIVVVGLGLVVLQLALWLMQRVRDVP
jgi:TRAP-type C4-dicarboxylate transport system permease small subunit